jgi:peptidoglycan hydrolase-like protein with peptidoglycan-binding domain
MYVAPTSTPQSNVAPATAQAATGTYVFKTLLTVGSTGPDVMALQQLLVKLNFLSVTPTGYFGSLTKRALQYYQTAHSISSVGYAGPATRASLNTGK